MSRAPRVAALTSFVWALALIVALLVPRSARAGYVAVNATTSEVQLRVDAAGLADVQHRLGYRVAAGAMHQVDLTGVADSAVLEPVVVITHEDGTQSVAHAARTEDKMVR